LENEPKFIQSGVEIYSGQSQKRTQIAGLDEGLGSQNRVSETLTLVD